MNNGVLSSIVARFAGSVGLVVAVAGVVGVVGGVGPGVGVASAAPITFTFTGQGSGTLNGKAFTQRNFTFTAQSDTTLRTSFVGGFSTVHNSAVIDIAGLGSFDLLTATRTFVANSSNLVGLSRVPSNDLINGPTNTAFSSWDMLSSIGPINGQARLLQWGLSPVNTSGGVLAFTNTPDSYAGTFAATVIPAPGAGAGAGLLAGLLARRRRRRTT